VVPIVLPRGVESDLRAVDDSLLAAPDIPLGAEFEFGITADPRDMFSDIVDIIPTFIPPVDCRPYCWLKSIFVLRDDCIPPILAL